jgi:hypothetical protein
MEQLAAATSLDALGHDATFVLLRHRNGDRALHMATLQEMGAFLSHSVR